MLEEKLDLLTKEIVGLRKAVEANTAAGGATSGDKAPADKPKRGRPAKEDVTPEHDQDEVEAIVRQVSREVGKPVAQKLIKSFKCDDLADLLTHPEHYDAAYAAAEAELEPEAGSGDDDI